jgi:hypothetical protein
MNVDRLFIQAEVGQSNFEYDLNSGNCNAQKSSWHHRETRMNKGS